MTYEVQQYTFCEGWVNTWQLHHGGGAWTRPNGSSRFPALRQRRTVTGLAALIMRFSAEI